MFYVHDGNPTPFNALIETKRLAYDAAAGQPPMPHAKWMPGSNYYAMEYDGVPVSIPKLCATASILVDKARSILREDCFLDWSIPADTFLCERELESISVTISRLLMKVGLLDIHSLAMMPTASISIDMCF
jgi:hypothetical protein